MNIDFPFAFGTDGRTASCRHAAHVRDMIELVLFTQPGERLVRPDFGTGLLQLVFAPNSPELAASLQLTVHSALTQWLGDLIEVRDLEVEAVDATLRVHLRYALTSTGEMQDETFTRSVT
jgi:uncharacterized protein